MTHGNYQVLRAVAYPDFPESLLAFDVQVTAKDDDTWESSIVVHGTYDGPTEVIRTDEYHLTWLVDGTKLLETGSATLELASGQRIRQRWSAIITPGDPAKGRSPSIGRFPAQGEIITATITPFKIDGYRMSYDWDGTVQTLTSLAE